ncbi:unnamed protein product [Blepharisma stoltei]|uniref:Vacuolar ATPase assembly integral membrane protein VMA21 homolog n=1 Tax=Blepharisma stoltei TaxID=1481888 RepID=A0AAU9JI47_9CILI|nr:unnamed protein product [Blepharisma stoltei]
MLSRFEPTALRTFIITTLSIIVFPVMTYYIASYLTSDFLPSNQIIISGFSAVFAVHIVIGCFLFKVYKDEIVKNK